MIRNGDEVSLITIGVDHTPRCALRPISFCGLIGVRGRIAPGAILFKFDQHAATGVSLSDHVGGLVGGEQTGGDTGVRGITLVERCRVHRPEHHGLVDFISTPKDHLVGALALNHVLRRTIAAFAELCERILTSTLLYVMRVPLGA